MGDQCLYRCQSHASNTWKDWSMSVPRGLPLLGANTAGTGIVHPGPLETGSGCSAVLGLPADRQRHREDAIRACRDRTGPQCGS